MIVRFSVGWGPGNRAAQCLHVNVPESDGINSSMAAEVGGGVLQACEFLTPLFYD
jgi:hypothetical protein